MRRRSSGLSYLSVCSGIEAASVAWNPLGMHAVGFAEIEPFCCALLNSRWPGVQNHGDFTTIQAVAEPVDILVGGTPCQSFSVAGNRAGMDDPRGNLAIEYLRLAQRLKPRWLVWENVPGILSSAGGRDFGIFLGTLCECGYGFAYRVLDAQYFGIPQRRRRVFVVGYLGDWRRAAGVLFDSESLCRHPAPSREAWEVAPTIPSRRSAGGGFGTDFDCDGGLIPQGYGGGVRRLTPLECERLQGFPDGYTAVEYRKKPAADGPRYKALGNSMAVPVMAWIGRRLALCDSL